ncbi:unnamed protein product [Adineta ricciae]|uniref:Uncharacterized protein n=2 Tax=Adineta ricciae TaxID=249248 RepID=A0A814R8Q3_ADIRI|nr:unnamed protein product [Adineta ricciae]
MSLIFSIVFVLIVQHASATIYECSCHCPYGSNSSLAFASENSSEACVRACIASPFNPCVSANTYACSGTDCAYSSSYDNSTTFTVTSLFRCSCQCPYGSIQTSVYTSNNSPEACVRACIASPFNPCISSNTYACLGTNCMYSSLYDSPVVTNTIVQRFQCTCQCPYGSTPSFAYTSENSSQACIRACIASPLNPCIPWNTYACLGTDCVYANWYIHSRRILAAHRPCTCQCPLGSSRASAFAIEDSSQNCATVCNSTLEISAMEDNTTIDSIIDEFDSVYNINYVDTKRNETSITTGGVTFGADEDNEVVDPKDVTVLASYRRAINRHMYTDEARFEQVQIRVRHHLLRTLGCKVADIEKILQWSWIPRDNCGFRLAGQPLKVPIPPNGKVYSMIHGISFYDNGSFFLNLTEADEGSALFNSDDVELIMKHGITGASFSLDPPLGSDLPHPFQKATWAPYDTLNGTDFLATMLHADLWLKSMSFLVEASVKSPFRA